MRSKAETLSASSYQSVASSACELLVSERGVLAADLEYAQGVRHALSIRLLVMRFASPHLVAVVRRTEDGDQFAVRLNLISCILDLVRSHQEAKA